MATLINTALTYLWIVDFMSLCLLALVALKHGRLSSALLTQASVVIVSGTVIRYQAFVNGFIAPTTSDVALFSWFAGFIVVDLVSLCLVYYFYRRLLRYLRVSKRTFTWLRWLLIVSLTGLLLNMCYSQYYPLLSGQVGDWYRAWVIMAFYIGVALFDAVAAYLIYCSHLLWQIEHSVISRMYLLAFSIAATLQVLRFCQKYFFSSNDFQSFYQLSLASINLSTSLVTFLFSLALVYKYYQLDSQQQKPGGMWRF